MMQLRNSEVEEMHKLRYGVVSWSFHALPSILMLGNLEASHILSFRDFHGDIREVDLIPESRRHPGRGHGNLLQYSSWRIPWTEEPGRLPSIGSQRVGHD